LRRASKFEAGELGYKLDKLFLRLRQTPTVRGGPLLPYELSFLSDDTPNAFSTAAGKVYVNSGMLPILQENGGFWAALLVHELAHTVLSHPRKAYERAQSLQRLRDAYQQQAALGNKWAVWAGLATRIAGDLVTLKFSRDEESEADAVGVKMLAEAGYHPAFSLALIGQMRQMVKDNSRLVTFLTSGHPRWTTREARMGEPVSEALQTFETKWPDPRSSRGGVPPTLAWLQSPMVTIDKRRGMVVIKCAYSVKYWGDGAGDIEVQFFRKGKPAFGSLPGFQDNAGHFVLRVPIMAGPPSGSGSFQTSIPSSTAGKDRELEAVISIIKGGVVLDESAAVKVVFPKPVPE
jgi:hypothetical protein